MAEAHPGLRDHCHLQDGLLCHDDQLELQAGPEQALDLRHGAEGRASPVPCSCPRALALATEDGSPEASDDDGHRARRRRGDGHHTSVGETAHQGEQKAQLGDGRLLSASLVLPPSCRDLLQYDTVDIPGRLSRRERKEFFVERPGPQPEHPLPSMQSVCYLLPPLRLARLPSLPLSDLLCPKVKPGCQDESVGFRDISMIAQICKSPQEHQTLLAFA